MGLPSSKADWFGTDDLKETAKRWESYKKSLNKSIDDGVHGRVGIAQYATESGPGTILTKNATTEETLGGAIAVLEKAISPEMLTSIRAELEASKAVTADLAKDISLTTPISTGLVPFDLEAPSKKLTPRPTPLRNKLPRGKGVGLSHRYKRITGYTGTGTGGVGNIHPGIADSTQNNFANPGSGNALNYNRGPKITYAGDDQSVGYSQFSLSDELSWSTQFQSAGFEDIRQLSLTSLTYASMLMEERMLLAGRGTGSGFVGALGVPGTVSLSVRNAGTGETGNTANIANLWVTVTAEGMFGESTMATVVSTTGMSAATGKVVDVALNADVTGATGYRVFASITDATRGTQVFQGRTGFSSTATGQGSAMFTIQFTGAGTGGFVTGGANPPAAESASYAAGYDGILTIAQGANSGYVKRINGKFSTSNPGTEFQTLFASLYNAVKADPDEVLIQGNDRVQLSDLLKTASSSNYRLTVRQDEVGNAILGDVITAIQNEVTGRVVPLSVHPWLPQGNACAVSYSLPIPDTQVDSVFKVVNVQDFMAVQWPVSQFSYDSSTYWLGTFVCYAPAWIGYLGGIQQV